MGRRGPVPTPTAEKLRRGETRPSRLNLLEPLPSRDLPKLPHDMAPEAKAVWRRVVRAMRHTGVIRSADADVFRCYCEAVVAYVAEARRLAAEGAVIQSRRYSRAADDGDDGEQGGGVELIKNPRQQVVRDNRDAVRLFARELGLSPSARVGLRIEREHANDSLTAVIGLPPRLRAVSDVG